jgi:hypothetical protein
MPPPGDAAAHADAGAPAELGEHAAAADAAPAGLEALPPAVAHAILLLLPVDARLRCREVCRAWRALAAEPRLWAVADLSAAGGAARPTAALLRAAAAAARGALRVLDLTDAPAEAFVLEDLHAVVDSNAASLTDVRLSYSLRDGAPPRFLYGTPLFRQLLSGALPSLARVEASVECAPGEAVAALGADARLAVRALSVAPGASGDGFAHGAAVAALAAAVAAHAPLRELRLSHAPLGAPPATLAALVAAACERRLHLLRLSVCQLTPAALPALAAALAGGALRELDINNDRELLFEQGAALDGFCAALRRCALQALTLRGCALWEAPAADAAVLAAASGHATLAALSLASNTALDAEAAAAAAAAFAGLLAADAPALTALDISHCALGGETQAALFGALARNSHLRVLRCAGNDLSAALAEAHVLPAVARAAALRELRLSEAPGAAPRRSGAGGAAGDDARGRLAPLLARAARLMEARRADAGDG